MKKIKQITQISLFFLLIFSYYLKAQQTQEIDINADFNSNTELNLFNNIDNIYGLRINGNEKWEKWGTEMGDSDLFN